MSNVILDNLTINPPVVDLTALAAIPAGALSAGDQVFVISPGITYIWSGSAWAFTGVFPPVADAAALSAIVTTGFVTNEVLVLQTDTKTWHQWNGATWVVITGTAASKAASDVSFANLASVSGTIISGQFAQFEDTAGTIGASGATSLTFLQSANNLSDLASAATARTNLSLGDAALKGVTNNTYTNVSTVAAPVTIGNQAVFADTAGTLADGGAPGGAPYSVLGTGMVFNVDFTTINSSITNVVPANAVYNYYVLNLNILINNVFGGQIKLNLTDSAGANFVVLNVDSLAAGYYSLQKLIDLSLVTFGAQWWSPYTNLPLVLVYSGAPLTAGNVSLEVEFVAVP